MKKLLLAILLLAEISFAQSLGLGLEINNRWDSDVDVTPPAERMVVRTSEGHIVRTSDNNILTVKNHLLGYEIFNENYWLNRFAINEFILPDLSGLRTKRYRITKYIK